jgi:anthranilate synthase/aminodeoxychorismate synthase-like glutamine amidotransferase
MILLIDNYDSFTYNLKQCVETVGRSCLVIRNDAISLSEIAAMSGLDAIIISPGPGRPFEAGISLEAIRRFAGQIPILGVCLGHQAIGEAFGGRVIRAPRPKHGKLSAIRHAGRGIFEGLKAPLRVTRYHSLIIERSSLPSCLEITAETADGLIMGIRHRGLPGGAPVEGVQFHPESVATEKGEEILVNFLEVAHA